MRVFVLISWLVFLFGWDPALAATSKNEAQPAVMLEIQEGDTAFWIDTKRDMAWWIVGECRRALPLETNRPLNDVMSRPLVDEVTLGSRQIRLQQQFRFDLASTPPTISVFNSVRSGWSPVPAKRIDACELLLDCRARTELPEC